MPRDGHTGRHQRVDGAARLAYARRGGVSALADLYQRAPCRLLFPDAGPDEPPQAVLLTTSGGLTGGDRLAVAVEVAASAAATVTAQAAEKLYRAGEDDCAVDIALTVGPGAWAEWLMQETILFDGARLRRRTAADIAPGGRLLAVESVVFGRAAMGEDFRRGLLHDSWRVR
ncbi:MAG TPA: urease accessory protein UreD, partial [Alphaproteobacteria bacterium]|nr:urease accessory protein UreD [Alphaproteobacteria bacterium]